MLNLIHVLLYGKEIAKLIRALQELIPVYQRALELNELHADQYVLSHRLGRGLCAALAWKAISGSGVNSNKILKYTNIVTGGYSSYLGTGYYEILTDQDKIAHLQTRLDHIPRIIQWLKAGQPDYFYFVNGKLKTSQRGSDIVAS